MVCCAREHWRPPLFTANVSNWQKLKGLVRRYFDIQAGSIWRDLAEELPKVSGTVLDVGCGSQPYRILFSPDTKYIGIDTADAKAHFGYEMPDTIYYSGDTLPVESESVDFILCTETLEHILEPAIFLDEMCRCLRNDGRIILTVPFAARWHFIPYDYWRFTPSGLRHLLDKAGFIGVEVYARGNALTVACYKNMALFLPLLFYRSANLVFRWMLLLLGLATVPVIAILAFIANLSLRFKGGEDCLGYTVVCVRGPRKG